MADWWSTLPDADRDIVAGGALLTILLAVAFTLAVMA